MKRNLEKNFPVFLYTHSVVLPLTFKILIVDGDDKIGGPNHAPPPPKKVVVKIILFTFSAWFLREDVK